MSSKVLSSPSSQPASATSSGPFVSPTTGPASGRGDWGSARPYSVSAGGRSSKTISSRRSGYSPAAPSSVTASCTEPPPPTSGFKQPAEVVARPDQDRGRRRRHRLRRAGPGCFRRRLRPQHRRDLCPARRLLPPRRQLPPVHAQANGRLGSDPRPAPGRSRTASHMSTFSRHCRDLIRTLPMMQHDEHQPRGHGHRQRGPRRGRIPLRLMSRPFAATITTPEDRNPLLVANAFKLHELH